MRLVGNQEVDEDGYLSWTVENHGYLCTVAEADGGARFTVRNARGRRVYDVVHETVGGPVDVAQRDLDEVEAELAAAEVRVAKAEDALQVWLDAPDQGNGRGLTKAETAKLRDLEVAVEDARADVQGWLAAVDAAVDKRSVAYEDSVDSDYWSEAVSRCEWRTLFREAERVDRIFAKYLN